MATCRWNVAVSDDDLGPITGPLSGDDGDGNLEPGETWVCEATGIAEDLSTPGTSTTFTTTGSSSTDGSNGNIRTYTSGGISLNASGFSRDSYGAWETAWLGAYSDGLGVTDNSEGNGGHGRQRVDNLGRVNYVLFAFSENVIVDRAFLDSVQCDSDITIWIGTIADAFTSPVTLSDTVLSSLDVFEINNTGNRDSRWADINAGEVAGNVLVIAASTVDTTPNDDPSSLILDSAAMPNLGVPQQTLELSVSFTDALGDGNYSSTVDWGDGTSEAGQIDPGDAGGTLTVSHAYDGPGDYLLRTTIEDELGNDLIVERWVSIESHLLQDAPNHLGLKTLTVGGTSGNDVIRFAFLKKGGLVSLRVNGKTLETLPQNKLSQLIAYGGGGADAINVDVVVRVDAEIHGGDGADRLYGGQGDDVFYAGPGNDIVRGRFGNDQLHGDSGNDYVDGGPGEDIVRGGEGNDKLVGYTGNDELDGGAGNDKLRGMAGADVLLGGPGRDWVNGGAGDDLLRGGDGNDALVGGSGNDILDGGWGIDKLWGLSGQDLLQGGGGVDFLKGGPAGDILLGGAIDNVNDAALRHILDRWTFGGPGRSIAERSEELADWLNALSIVDHLGSSDELSGGSGADWLLPFPDDRVRGMASEDLISQNGLHGNG